VPRATDHFQRLSPSGEEKKRDDKKVRNGAGAIRKPAESWEQKYGSRTMIRTTRP